VSVFKFSLEQSGEMSWVEREVFWAGEMSERIRPRGKCATLRGRGFEHLSRCTVAAVARRALQVNSPRHHLCR